MIDTDSSQDARGKKPATVRYRKVPVSTWDDPAFRALSAMPPCGQGLYLYLKTGPHTGAIPGLSRVGRAALAEELGWEPEAFDDAFREVIAHGLAKADFKARVVWLPGEFQHNRPESINVVKSWSAAAPLIPDCDLKAEALATIRAGLRTMGDAFFKAWEEAAEPSSMPSPKASAKASPKARAIQEQEQEQEQQQQAGVKARASRTCPDDFSPSPELLSWARLEAPGLDLEHETKSFRLYDRKKPVSDWPRAWKAWVLNAKKFAAERGGARGSRPGALALVSGADYRSDDTGGIRDA